MPRNYQVPTGFTPGVPQSLAPVFGGQKRDYLKNDDVELFNISTELFNKVKVKNQATGEITEQWVSPPIDADGNGIFTLPPIGESIIVPRNVADILIRKTQTGYRPGHRMYGKGIPQEGMTTNAELARVVKDAYERQVPLDQAIAEFNSVALPDEVVLKVARERGLIPDTQAPEVIEPDNDTLLRLIKERGLADLLTQDTEKTEKHDSTEAARGPGRPPANKGGK